MAKLASTARQDGRSKTTRSMRSQSNEPSTLKRGKGSNRASATSNNASMPIRRRGRPSKTAAAVERELATVDEDAPGESESEAEDASQPEQEEAQNAPRTRVSAGSGISGTTAKTSFSQEEIDGLDPEVMVDVLPSLAASSEQMAKLLAPQGRDTPAETWKEIRRTGSKHNKLYANRMASLKVHKSSFGSQDYIQPHNVLRALLNVRSIDEIPFPGWRPDNILLQVNLVQMLNSLVITCNPSDWGTASSNALETLDRIFPSAIAGGEFQISTIEFYLSLATQLCIALLEAYIESEARIDPHVVIENVFYNDDSAFKYNDALGISSATEGDRAEAMSMVTIRITDLKGIFEKRSRNPVVTSTGELKARYSWDSFREEVLNYYDDRTKQLTARIAAGGGVDTIVSRLSEEIDRRTTAHRSEQAALRFSKPGTTPQKSFDRDAMAFLREQERKLMDEGVEAAPVAPMLPHSTAEVHFQDIDEDEDEDDNRQQVDGPADVPGVHDPAKAQSEQVVSELQKLQNQEAQKAKERAKSLSDRQENAERVTWDESQMTQQPRPNDIGHPTSSAASKRTHADMEEEGVAGNPPNPTQDEGFQVDTRDLTITAQRRKEASFVGRQSLQAPRITFVLEDQPSQPKIPRKNPGSSYPPPTQPLEPEAGEMSKKKFFERAKMAAQHNRVTASHGKSPQIRTPWVEEEELALLQLIEEHGGEGVSYSALKKIDEAMHEDGKLGRRSAEDMRFKARNMKVTMLRARTVLPRNWEHVVLDRKAIEKLASLGIHHSQERIRSI